jgi:biotin-dependent carboxylase-like uncharacterized protein
VGERAGDDREQAAAVIEIVRRGVATSVQDRGRPGWAHLGVGRSGAADLAALGLANRLVGNPAGSAALETSGGLRFRLRTPAMVALAGAPARVTVAGGPPVGVGAPQSLPAGADVTIAFPTNGLRTYVAFRGGLATAVVLGSRSLDTLGHIGIELADGDVLPIGADPGTPVGTDVAPQRPWHDEIGIVPGPRLDWFTADAWDLLTAQRYLVATDTDRVGARLRGAQPLRRARDGELAPEGIVLGAVQVPPDGQPIVMLADHPVTGGYPVIAVVDETSIAAVAQSAPGSQLSFRTVAH